MPQHSENGLTLRWDAPDLAPGRHALGGARILVGASPPHPANVVTLSYTVDGGAARSARGYRLAPALNGQAEEIFAVDLPRLAPGSRLAVLPLLSCSGRHADPRRAGIAETPVALPAAAAPAPVPAPAVPAGERRFPYAAEFLARVTARLEKRPEMVGETPHGLRIIFLLEEGGTVRGPRLNGRIEHGGGDWMLVRPDGIGISEIQVLIRTDDGALVLGEYEGVVDFGTSGHAALASGAGPARAAIQLAPRYVTSSERYTWLNRLQCIGVGCVTMSTMLVEYDLYAIRSRAAGVVQGDHDG